MTFFRYLGDCFFYAYLVLFLKDRGLLESQIGIIIAINPLAAILASLIWNHFAKNVNINRIMMIVITIIEGILIFNYTKATIIDSFIALTIITALIGTPFYSLHDGFCEAFAEINNKSYATIRSFGALGYFVATLLSAFILYVSKDNYDILFYLASILFILTSLWFKFIKPIDLKKIDNEPKRNYEAVLKNKTFWIFLIIDVIIFGASYGADSYVSLYFTEIKGLSPTVWSIVFGGMLGLEFVIMIISSRFKHINENIALIIYGVSFFLRSLILAFDLPLPFIIIASLLRGVAYGFYFPYLVKAIKNICGLKNVTCALFVLFIFKSIFKSIALVSFGTLIEFVGYYKFYMISAIVLFIGVALNLIFNLVHKFKYPIYNEVNSK
jgi:predicted MFS family arabinose efflux permease